MPDFLEAVPSAVLVLAPIALSLAWAGYSFNRRWKSVRGSINSMLRSVERVAADITMFPWIEGIITEARVESFQSNSMEGKSETTLYRAELVYEYAIDGKQYSSTNGSFGIASSDPALAKEIVQKYPPGTRVRVHFRREEPAISYLGIEEMHANAAKLRSVLGDGVI